MSDESLIATLENGLRHTRNIQNRLMARLKDAESEVELLRIEINALENSASQTEKLIDTLLIESGGGARQRSTGTTFRLDDDGSTENGRRSSDYGRNGSNVDNSLNFRRDGSVAYLPQNRGIPAIMSRNEPLSNRFSDRTIIQACTLLLREANGPLHVNELYNLLIAGGMKFKGNNPTISIAVSLNRSKRFRKVGPGTFDIVIREALQAVS